MKNRLTLLLLLFLFSVVTYAQDTLVRMDSVRIVGKVISVSDKTITYTRGNNSTPTYEVSRHNIARIIYADGTIERYGTTSAEEMSGDRPNIVSITTTDLVAGVATINYERVIGNEIGIRVIGSMGILGMTGKTPDYYTGSYYYNRFKIFSVGTDVHYYIYRGNRISYYAGALIEYGMVKQRDYYWDFPPYGGGVRTREYYMGGLTNGMSIRTNSNVTLDMFLSLGWKRESNWNGGDIAARFGFSAGYRF